MSIKKILASLFALSLIFSLASCGDTCADGHIDEDVDFFCDECGEPMPCDHADENGDFLCDKCGEFYEAPIVYADFTVTVKSESGAAVSGVKAIITDDDGVEVLNDTTGADGKVGGNLPTGRYYVSFEIDSDGYVYVPNGFIEIKKENNDFTYVTVDNTPDGSAEKPFFISEDTATYTIPANTTFTFTIKGTERTLVIENAAVKLNYKGVDYAPEAGKIEVRVSGAIDANSPPTPFTVTNTTSSETEVTLSFVSDPGTRENPYAVELGEVYTTEVITNEDIVYYAWTATAQGTLTISSETAGNVLKLTNLTKSKVSDYTNGTAGASVTLTDISAGDKILIEVSIKSVVAPEDPDNPTEDELIASGAVSFTVTLGN